MNASEIADMSIEERIEVMEAIWGSLLKSDSDIESPDWHTEILTERRRRIDDSSAEFVSLAELKAARR